MEFTAYVMEWNVDRATGAILFESDPLRTTNNGGAGGWEEFSVDTGGLFLTEGKQYVAFFSSSTYPSTPQGAGWVAYVGERYSDGMFVYIDNGSDFSALTNNPWVTNYPVGDLAFTMRFNSPPIADAGPDQMLLAPIGSVVEVTLDGSGSTDAEGDELTYIWTWTVDVTYTEYGVNPVITLPVGGHVIELVVSDGEFDSEPDYVTIKVLDITVGLAEQISTMIIDKLDLVEQIKNAIEKEQYVHDTLKELLDIGVYTGLANSDMVKAKQKIHSAIQHQEQATKDLELSIEKLEDALESLGSPVEP